MNTDFKEYYAVIFTSELSGKDTKRYEQVAEEMVTLAKQQPGFVGIDSVRNDLGITISYWESLEDIKNWKMLAEHMQAQKDGREFWYVWYSVKICKVMREYGFPK